MESSDALEAAPLTVLVVNASRRESVSDDRRLRDFVKGLQRAGIAVRFHEPRASPLEVVRLIESGPPDSLVLVGFSLLESTHLTAVPRVMARLRDAGRTLPVFVGGAMTDEDARALRATGVKRVFTPGLGNTTIVGQIRAAATSDSRPSSESGPR